jgi:hypothetical protein
LILLIKRRLDQHDCSAEEQRRLSDVHQKLLTLFPDAPKLGEEFSGN